MDIKKITILYATSTGTAYDISQRLSLVFSGHNDLTVNLLSVEDYNPSFIEKESFLIVVCATAGEGEPPFQMKEFWRYLLLKKHSSDLLKDLKFAVFGLGDSSYNKYNYPAKKLYNRMKQLSATPICKLGLGDDQHVTMGVEYGYNEWKRELLEKANLKENRNLYPLS